jgi:hypothetical protein
MNVGLAELKKGDNPLDLYTVARFMYKVNAPILTNQAYDKLHNYIKGKFPQEPLLRQTYDEDAYPEEVFRKYNLALKEEILAGLNEKRFYDNPNYSSIKSLINNYRTNSVRPVENYEDAWEWFKTRLNKDIVLSLKVNGINTRSFISKVGDNADCTEYSLLCSSTRAREGEGWDITENLSRKFPKKIDFAECDLEGEISGVKVVYGEAYVKKSSLEFLRRKYGVGDTWKTPRSTALSMLRVNIRSEDYSHMRLKVFKVSDLAKTLSGTLSEAEKVGFDVVPWKLVRGGGIPTNFEVFKKWLKWELDYFAKISEAEDIESDGMVAEVDDQLDFAMEGSEYQYNVGNIALKMEKWSSDVYTAEVIDILFELKKDRYSVRAVITPTMVANGNVIKLVNCFNPDILMKEGIRKGSIIKFEYKSDANVNLIYNKK